MIETHVVNMVTMAGSHVSYAGYEDGVTMLSIREGLIFVCKNHKWCELQINYSQNFYIFDVSTEKFYIMSNHKILKRQTYFICEMCEKITKQIAMRRYENMELCCHCLFNKCYDSSERNKYDCEPMTIVDYISKCSEFHDSVNCSHSDRCFLCDHNKGKIHLDIKNWNKLYGNRLNNLSEKCVIDITI